MPHVETKGDANEEPDPAVVPRASIIGRVDVALPLLGYLAVLLTSVPGFVGFVALVGSLLIMSGALEELEDRFGPVCEPEADAATRAIEPNDLDASADGGLAAPVGLAAPAGSIAAASIDAPASRTSARTTGREPAVSRVRETGRSRDTHVPVLLEQGRRNPRRHGIATAAATAPQHAPELAA